MEYLKIKDGVDLKELEKYGFTYNTRNKRWENINECEMMISISAVERFIEMFDDSYFDNGGYSDCVILFDLV